MRQNKNNISSISVKPVHSRYISFDEDIFQALNVYETRVYMALRYHADFRKQSSDVEITINQLVEESKVKRSTLFVCLQALEKKYCLIRRLNWDKGTYGKINEYEVAQHLYHFKAIEIEEKPSIPQNEKCTNCNSSLISFDNINGSYKEGVQHMDGVVQHMDTPVQHMDGVVHQVHTVESEQKEPYKETYYPQPVNEKSKLTLQEMTQTNPHNLPVQMIQDWIENRKAAKKPVTVTAWIRLNKQLHQCPDPIEAFEECVGAGWLSFKAEWINKPKDKKSHFDNESTDWAKGIEQDMF